MRTKYEIKMTSKGQLTLPQNVREGLIIGKNSKLILNLKNGIMILTPMKDSIVDKLIGLGKSTKTSLQLYEEFKREVEKKLRLN